MVDKEPREGRYLIRIAAPSTSFYPWPQLGGVITKVSGQRVYFNETMPDGHVKETFTHHYYGVCDSEDEAAPLFAFTAAGTAMVEKLKATLAELEVEALTQANSGGQGQKRTRRQRTK